MKEGAFACWITRLLYALVVFGAFAVGGLWWLYATAKCEGFGCLGLGWLFFLLVIISCITSAAAGMLYWLTSHGSRNIPRWLYVLMALNISPLIWLILKMSAAR